MSLFLLFCGIVDSKIIDDVLVERYLTGHPVSRTTTALFCVGLAALLLAAKDVFGQFASERRVRLVAPESPNAAETETDESLSRSLLCQLDGLPRRLQNTYLFQRLQNVLKHVVRNGASESTESELRFLAEADLDRRHARYSLVRILIWAIPLLGFLGTVLGISEALGKLSVGASEDLPAMIAGLQSSLYVAFDTTAQALVLSIALMFTLYLVDRFEAQLLNLVDHRTLEIVSGFFDFMTPANQAANQVNRLGRRLLVSTRNAVKEHTEIWRNSMASAEKAWTSTQHFLHADLREQIGGELDRVLQKMTCDLQSAMVKSIEMTDESMNSRIGQWQSILNENARQLSVEGNQLTEQTKLIGEVLTQLESVATLQTAVNRSLDALTSTARLDVAITDLVTAIQSLRSDLARPHREETPTLRILRPDEATLSLRLHEGSKRAA
jgi:biopolymer transport protein ExbB/TolQ